MRAIYIIVKKEIGDQFVSPLIYILTSLFCLIIGWPFYNRILLAREWTSGTIVDGVLRPTFGDMASLFLFLVPLITMRSFAEEKKQRTLELLFLSHCSDGQIIVGKFLSSLCISLFMLSFSLIFPMILTFSGYAYISLVAISYLGLILHVALYTAVGIFSSSLTENQILSALLSFAVLLGLMLLLLVGHASDNYLLSQMLSYLSPQVHLESFFRGSLVSYNVAFYFSSIFFFLFLTSKSLDSRNW